MDGSTGVLVTGHPSRHTLLLLLSTTERGGSSGFGLDELVGVDGDLEGDSCGDQGSLMASLGIMEAWKGDLHGSLLTGKTLAEGVSDACGLTLYLPEPSFIGLLVHEPRNVTRAPSMFRCAKRTSRRLGAM